MFRSKWFLAGVAVLLLATSAILVAKPLYLKVRDMRASQLAHQARESYLAAPSDTAVVGRSIEKVSSALQLSPTNAAAHRALATVLLFSNPSLSLRHWEQAERFGIGQSEPTDADRLHHVQALLLNSRFAEAKQLLESMRGGPEFEADVQYNLTKVAYLLGESESALKQGRAMIRSRFTPIHRHLFFVQMCLSMHDSALQQEGESHLRFLLKQESLIDDSVVWQMLQLENLSEELYALLDETLHRRVTDFEEHIELVELRVKQGRLQAKDGARELRQAVNHSDSFAVVRLAQWLAKHGFSEAVVELMPLDLALSRKDWFLMYMKQLGELKSWKRILTILTEQRCPIEPFLVEILKCEAYYQNAEIPKALNAWYRAKLAANPVSSEMWLLIRTGDKIGQRHETERLLRDLVVMGERAERVLEYIASRDLRAGDYEGFLQQLTVFKEQYSNIATVVNDWAYYSILMGRDREEAMLEVDRWIEQHPEQLRFHMTWALGKIKTGEYRQVLARFQQFDLDWMGLHPKWRMILALALAGVGEEEQGKAYLKDLDLKIFNPYELALYEQLFTQQNAPSPDRGLRQVNGE